MASEPVSSAPLRIACLGAGRLGTAIMSRLLDCGFDLAVWNRSPEKLDDIVARGASPASYPAEAVAGRDFVITCLTDQHAVEAVVFGDGGVVEADPAPGLLIDMSTVDAPASRAMAAALGERTGVGWLDAPISGGPPAALKGSMAVMVGGDSDDFERARPIWDVLAGRCTHMGGPGAGQTTKMINQVLVGCQFMVVAEACGLAERAGLDPTLIPDALAGGRADSAVLQEYMAKMAKSDFFVSGSIGTTTKDLEMVRRLARSAGAHTPLTALVTEFHHKLMAAGHAEADNAEVIRLYRD